jgi:hypothetical protein
MLLVEDDPDERFRRLRARLTRSSCARSSGRGFGPGPVAEHPDIAVPFTDAQNAIMHRGVVDAARPSPSDL